MHVHTDTQAHAHARHIYVQVCTWTCTHSMLGFSKLGALWEPSLNSIRMSSCLNHICSLLEHERRLHDRTAEFGGPRTNVGILFDIRRLDPLLSRLPTRILYRQGCTLKSTCFGTCVPELRILTEFLGVLGDATHDARSSDKNHEREHH